MVYLVGADELWAIDEATGGVLWDSDQFGDGQIVVGSPIVADGQVIAAADTTLTRQPCITAFGPW